MPIQDEMAAALREHCRQSETLKRSIELLSAISLTGETFSYFSKGLKPEQERRAIAVHVKAGLVERVQDAIIRQVKAGYRLTSDWRPPVEEVAPVNTDGWEQADAPGPDEDYNLNALVLKCEVPDSDTIVEAVSYRPTAKEIRAQKREDDDYLAKVAHRAQHLSAVKAKLCSRSKSAEQVLLSLQNGERSRAQLVLAASSPASLGRLLRQLREAGLITSSRRNGIQIYRLVELDDLRSQKQPSNTPRRSSSQRRTTPLTRTLSIEGATPWVSSQTKNTER